MESSKLPNHNISSPNHFPIYKVVECSVHTFGNQRKEEISGDIQKRSLHVGRDNQKQSKATQKRKRVTMKLMEREIHDDVRSTSRQNQFECTPLEFRLMSLNVHGFSNSDRTELIVL